MEFFTNEKLSDHLTRITDFTGVCCYLVQGTQKALLLDTCDGFGNIKEYVETLTNLPIEVVLSHGHLDHAGGAGLYDKVYMNLDDMPVYQKHLNIDFKLDFFRDQVDFELKPESFNPKFNGEFVPIKDGTLFDLGGIHVKMIHVKGHTPGMMVPFIIEDRDIIFGDACGVGVLLFDEYSSNVSEYKESLVHLKTYEKDYDRIYRNHGTFTSSKVLLQNVIDCCDLILKHEDDHEPVTFLDTQLYACHKRDESGHGRADRQEGNILYSLDKVC